MIFQVSERAWVLRYCETIHAVVGFASTEGPVASSPKAHAPHIF